MTVEEHFSEVGLGGIVRRFRDETRSNWQLMTLGIPYKYIHEIKDTAGMRQHFGLSSSDIVGAIKDLLKG